MKGNLGSGLVVKQIRSHHSILPTSKNVNKLKNKQVFLDLSENWVHRANNCSQKWKEKLGRYNLVEQKPPWNYCQGRKIWAVIGELLDVQCLQVCLELYQEGGHSKYQRKISLGFQQGEGKVTTSNTTQHFVLLKKVCPSEKPLYQRPNLFLSESNWPEWKKILSSIPLQTSCPT